MMSYFFPAMLCSPHGEISTLKACRIIAYGLAHRFKGISYHMHAVGVREGAKHPTLGRLSFAALTCRQWQTSEAQLSHRSRKSAGCIAPDSRAALATRAACTQNHRLKSRISPHREQSILQNNTMRTVLYYKRKNFHFSFTHHTERKRSAS